jgi:hypothetical protein
VIGSRFGTVLWMTGVLGAGGKGRSSNFASTRNWPLWISEAAADGPSNAKSTLLVSRPWVTSALPL